MKQIIQWQTINEDQPLYQQLEKQLQVQKQLELKEMVLKYHDDPETLKKALQAKDSLYQLYQDKLELTSNFNNEMNLKQVPYVENMMKMDTVEELSEKQKLLMMLSYGVLVDQFNDIHELSFEEICMLSYVSQNLDIEDYAFDINLARHPKLAGSIVRQSKNIDEQRQIYDAMMNEIYDLFPVDMITEETYEPMVAYAIDLVKQYQPKQQHK